MSVLVPTSARTNLGFHSSENKFYKIRAVFIFFPVFASYLRLGSDVLSMAAALLVMLASWFITPLCMLDGDASFYL